MVDLSTAHSPETTWVIKNAHHDQLDPCMGIIRDFLNGTKETVDTVTGGVYYMVYDIESASLKPMTADNCGELPFMEIGEKNPTVTTVFKSFVEFCKMLFNLVVKLFKGELF